MKVVWLCSFSNALVREHLDIGIPKVLLWMYKKARGHVPFTTSDFGVWNSNAIKEFEKFDEAELHVISPCSFLKKRLQEFEINSIHYHFFRDENCTLSKMIYRQIVKPDNDGFSHNRRIIKTLISRIKPDIVHLIGAENPQYSLALLDIPSNIPTIAQLQTLLNDPDFKANFPIGESSYQYLSSVERRVLLRADYIGTKAEKFIHIIKGQIKPNAIIINTNLALGENINTHTQEKQFDFVYFASNINKACDIALEAFGMAYQINSSITMDVIGGYTTEFKGQLDTIIEKYDIADSVTFEGRLATHDDVLKQIRKAKYALLPLKIDLIASTIREAMSNGVPVLTTDTGTLGTQLLNKECQCALISPKNDCRSLACNMIRLLNDESLAEELRQNAFKRQQEKFNNEAVVHDYIEAYKLILYKCKN